MHNQSIEAKALLSGGKWIPGSGTPIHSTDPATGARYGTVSTASATDVAAAVGSARALLSSSDWTRLLPPARADYLHRISQRLLAEADALSEVVMHENGKTLRECVTQTRAAAATFRYYAGLCETLESEVTPSRGDYLSLTTYEPYGVVAAIVPWNSPLTLAADKVAPALAAGNAVILKPSELTSLCSLELGRICADAGLPGGVLSVLPGAVETSSSLVRDPGVNMISFTGGTAAGRAVAQAAAERLAPVVLELGGKSPNIVFEDADLDRAAHGVAAAIFGSLGQSCIAGSRLFVQRSICAQLTKKIVEIAEAIRLGPPQNADSQLGPLASFAHRERVHGVVSAAIADGAKLLTGGSPPAGAQFSTGAYYRPTVLDGVANDSIACRTEIFGPVLCILPFTDMDDVVQQANDTPYGLACGIWTNDIARAWTVARRIQAGTVWINTYRQNSVATPFGGFKQSGWGRERGPQGMRQYQQVKSVFLATGTKPLSLDR